MSRSIEKLVPKARAMYREFESKMKAAGIPFIVTCVDRTIAEQTALYAQGRESFEEVNRLRKIAGLYLFKSAGENKHKVTWTMKSKHITYPDDHDTSKHLARAFDLVIVKDGKASWDLKVNVNKNEIPDYEEAGRIWESLGGTWGGRWKKSPDNPHFEV